jgi:hypothetical protein
MVKEAYVYFEKTVQEMGLVINEEKIKCMEVTKQKKTCGTTARYQAKATSV